MEEIRVISWGLGSMGSGIAKMILNKKGMRIVGAVDLDPNKVGKKLHEILEIEPNNYNDIVITEKPEDVIKRDAADIVMIATSSFTEKVFPMIEIAAKAGINIITTAEEMSYPKASKPELAEKIDKLAKENSVAILGTGINPGFIMDLYAITLTGVCENIEKIQISRINDLSPFGKAVMDEQGIGLSPEEFEKGVREGTIAGHVGFLESFGMFEEALQIKFTKIEQKKEPIITNVPRSTKIVSVEPGKVAGCKQTGYAYLGDKIFIEMSHPQQICPEAESVETGDFIKIYGTPDIKLQIKPEIPGGIGTIAICVNMIPHVLSTSPGLKTMLDLPLPRVIIGDARNLIKK
ncbi:MAG TPA: NADP-binding protein [Tepidanaerobacter syntrophicus]|uniref:2,4-diaminopentanoate dehydrogenase n=1 Tax=Tepidanaerobacter syntrophicus TaxID=224999 RepID=UPI00176D13D4|nr:2,4-diaminopentanoate dehydrogenase [Tepidanaerobacter syntrophicus]HHV84029.1 NADP-binding protein [Tepidanaerobacter syntrophicus]